MLVLVTQGPDYLLPAIACLLQKRLGLPDSCATFDVNLGCSGFVYGSWIASQLLSGSEGKRALLLCGDVSTRLLHPDDRAALVSHCLGCVTPEQSANSIDGPEYCS